ncbi:unnamed protein product, partial [Lymnaea stagnalis]
VLKTTGIDGIKAMEKLSHSSVKKSLENRIKYKHKIVREKNTIVKPKKVVKKRIQYVFDDDENEEDDGPLFIGDDDDEDYEYDCANRGGKDTSKSDAEAKVRDREERALRREQLRDQSEESTTRVPTTSLQSSQSRAKDKNSDIKHKTRSKDSDKLKQTGGNCKSNGRISR